MDKDNKPSLGGLPSNGIVWLVIFAAGALFVHELPWKGSRPAAGTTPVYPSIAEQDIDARLWQDPLDAVARGREEARNRRRAENPGGSLADDHPAAGVASAIADASQGKRVLVLGVSIVGGPYPDSAETRRRARYAVLSGLNRAGFVPVDSDHLGYFTPTAAHLPRQAAASFAQSASTAPPQRRVSPEWRRRGPTPTSSSPNSSPMNG